MLEIKYSITQIEKPSENADHWAHHTENKMSKLEDKEEKLGHSVKANDN